MNTAFWIACFIAVFVVALTIWLFQDIYRFNRRYRKHLERMQKIEQMRHGNFDSEDL